MMNQKKETDNNFDMFAGSEHSLDRPAWLFDDIHAYRHKHCVTNGKYRIIKDYYVTSRGEK